MARRKRLSEALITARVRQAGLSKINQPNLSPNTTVTAYNAVVNDTAGLETAHNELAVQMDDSSNRFDAQEALLADWNGRILAAVAAQYGKDSSEYEMVGGTRTSDRKRGGKKNGGSSPANK